MSKGTLQRFTLLGRLGADPEVKKAKDLVVVKLSVATNESVKKKDSDEWQDETTWHHVTFFDKKAEFCRDYLKKGDAVCIGAKLHNTKWTDKAGKEQYGIDIIGSSIQLISTSSHKEEPLGDVV
jgi:single-strand DNA-binding protein